MALWFDFFCLRAAPSPKPAPRATILHMTNTNPSPSTLNPPRRTMLAALILLTLAALAARLYALDTVRFNIDHAYPIWQGMRTLDYQQWPLVGQATSVLFANPALTGYLYLPPLMLWRSPLGVYALVIALNALAVPFTFQAGRALLRRDAPALIAAALVAFNPWIIEYSRTTWVQSLMPFFVTLIAALIVPVWVGTASHRGRRMLAALIVATLFTQTYLLAFLIVAPLALISLILWRRIPWRYAAAGIVIFMLVTAAYGIALIQSPTANLDRTTAFTSTAPRLTDEALLHALRLTSGEGYAWARSANQPDVSTRQPLEFAVHGVLMLALISGVIQAGYALVKRTPRRDAALIALVWWALPVIAMSYTGSPVHPFYQLLGVPMGAVLAAWGVDALLQRRAGVSLITAALTLWAALMLLNFARGTQENVQQAGREGLPGLLLGDGLALGGVIQELLPPQGIVYANVNEWILNALAGRLFTVIDAVQSPRVTLVPQVGGLYIEASLPDESPFTPRLSVPAARLTLADDSLITVRRFEAGGADLTGVPQIVHIESVDGLTLAGYDRRTTRDGRHVLITYWRVDAVSDAARQMFYGPFAHVFNAEGERIAIADGVPLSGLLWNVGDVYIQRMTYDAPEDHRVSVGLYDINAARNAVFTLPDGAQDTLIPLD